ncbi:MAG TPA: hypothetical protein VEH04_16120, partial [Verrucomicrobiae bacterium]|nr:hypothetical protein [Verrucomicrobiae bacterium]
AATLSRSFVAPLHCNGLVLFLLIFALTATLTHPGSLKKDARRLPLTLFRRQSHRALLCFKHRIEYALVLGKFRYFCRETGLSSRCGRHSESNFLGLGLKPIILTWIPSFAGNSLFFCCESYRSNSKTYL